MLAPVWWCRRPCFSPLEVSLDVYRKIRSEREADGIIRQVSRDRNPRATAGHAIHFRDGRGRGRDGPYPRPAPRRPYIPHTAIWRSL